jgi:hypothetical protein
MSREFDVNRLMQEWRINGFVVFEGLIPLEKIDRIRQAWMPIRDDGIKQHGQGNASKHRYNIGVPFESPFVDEEIFEHPALVEFLERVLGPDYVCAGFDSNTPFPGSEYQSWHRDCYSLFPGLMTPAYQLGVKFPLVDTCEENGSFEVIPCTQHVADEDLQTELDDVIGAGVNRRAQYHPIRLNLKKGSLWVHDARVYHRGTPNRSDHSRDELGMSFCRPWLFSKHMLQGYTEPHFPRKLRDGLSPHAQQVLRYQRVKDD